MFGGKSFCFINISFFLEWNLNEESLRIRTGKHKRNWENSNNTQPFCALTQGLKLLDDSYHQHLYNISGVSVLYTVDYTLTHF